MKDRFLKTGTATAAFMVLLLCGAIFYSLLRDALPAFRQFGFWGFITSSQWSQSETAPRFGALPFIVGTLATSFIALLLCVPLSLSAALFTGEYFAGRKAASVLRTMIDLLAGIPSIVYGLWGFYVLRPLMAQYGSSQGFGILTASLVLAVMIIPYAASLSSEFVRTVPKELKEAAYSLGATRLEVIRKTVLPTVSSGLISSHILALGRALGETMAVTMLIGNTHNLPRSFSDTGNTMASIIANQFGEADGIKLSALIAIGLLLFLITAIINGIGRYIVKIKTT